MIFEDRQHAGQILARELTKEKILQGVILAVPRGGVIVGAEIASQLGLQLDIIVPRKIGTPGEPELAAGAVSPDGTVIYNRKALSLLNISEDELRPEIERQLKEIRRRMITYRGSDEFPKIHKKRVILVDDGIATGQTILAAIKSIKNFSPKEIILAVPVAPQDTLDALSSEVDKIICPAIPDNFFAVGQFYTKFKQVADEEVKKVLNKAKKV